MNCDRAQAVLSARLDGERAPERVGAAVDAHAATCARCRVFEAGALRVRTSVRVRPAEPVPDLVGSIMTRVTAEAGARPRRRGAGAGPPSPAPEPEPPARAGARGDDRRGHGRKRGRRRAVAAVDEHADRRGRGRGGRAGDGADARLVRGDVRRHRTRPVARRAGAAAADGRRVPGAAALPSGRPRRDHVPVDPLDADGPHVHRRRLVDVSLGGHRLSRRPARRRVPAHPHDHHHSLRLLGARAGAGRPGVAAHDVLVGRRHPGARDGSRRGTRRDPGATHVRTGTGVVPVPAARRDLASVLRRRPRGSLARCLGLVPVALHGLSVHRSGASPVGAPVRHRRTNRRTSRSSTSGSPRSTRTRPIPPRSRSPAGRARRACRSPRSPDASDTCRSRPRRRARSRSRRRSCRPATTPTRRAPSSCTRTAWRTCGSGNARTGPRRGCSVRWTRAHSRWTCREAASRTTSRRATAWDGDSRSTRRRRTSSSSPTCPAPSS